MYDLPDHVKDVITSQDPQEADCETQISLQKVNW